MVFFRHKEVLYRINVTPLLAEAIWSARYLENMTVKVVNKYPKLALGRS